MLDLAHVGRLRVAIEELPHRLAGVVTGLGEGLSHETIAGAVLRAMIAHPVRKLTRVLGPAIAATPYKAMPIRLVRFRSGQVRSNPLLQGKGAPRLGMAKPTIPQAEVLWGALQPGMGHERRFLKRLVTGARNGLAMSAQGHECGSRAR